MKTKIINIIMSFLASVFFTGVIITIFLISTSFYKKGFYLEDANTLIPIALVSSFLGFLFLAFSKYRKATIFLGLTALFILINGFVLVFIDENLTYKNEFTNIIYNVFRWYRVDLGLNIYEHEVLGFLIFIFPVIILISGLESYYFIFYRKKKLKYKDSNDSIQSL